LIGSEEELSLNHFAIELDVSRNTILNDLKQVRIVASGFKLSVKYSRAKGYIIEGEEFHIRKLLFNVIDNMLQIPSGEERVKVLVGIEETDLLEVQSRIEKVENKLNLKFTDEKVIMMPYDLLLVLRRVRMGKVIESFSIE
ncbi:helix-turn-helix domain-containing protein, partial [Micrococcus sp. SIMBA_144]